jgi:hypothetical protein
MTKFEEAGNTKINIEIIITIILLLNYLFLLILSKEEAVLQGMIGKLTEINKQLR